MGRIGLQKHTGTVRFRNIQVKNLATVREAAQRTPAKRLRGNRRSELVGVSTSTASGLVYCDVKAGAGETPKIGQSCVVHYTGWLWENNAKGEKFDSSLDKGRPFEFVLVERK